MPDISYIAAPVDIDLTDVRTVRKFRRDFAMNMFKPEAVEGFLTDTRTLLPSFFDVFRSKQRTCKSNMYSFTFH